MFSIINVDTTARIDVDSLRPDAEMAGCFDNFRFNFDSIDHL